MIYDLFEKQKLWRGEGVRVGGGCEGWGGDVCVCVSVCFVSMQ